MTDRLRLYRVDTAYVAELARVDHNVMSTSPREGKARRPFAGVVVPRAASLKTSIAANLS